MTDISAAIQSQLNVVRFFNPDTQIDALSALASDPASIGETDRRALATLAQRTMQLQLTIQDGEIWIADNNVRVQLELAALKAPSGPF